MNKIICKLFGHQEEQAYSGSLIYVCKRCGRLSEFTKFLIKTL